MKFIKTISFFVFLVFTTNINAQKLELGKVTIDELKEKLCPSDTSAPATILFKKGEVRYEYNPEKGFVMVTNVKIRIKIYKKEGYDFANHSVRYYTGDGAENVSFTNAITYNIVGDKIEKTKLSNEGAFDEKINKYFSHKKITMPNVKEGSVIEYEYKIKSSARTSFRDWYFQYNIPVKYSEFKTFIPEYFTFVPNHKGYFFPKVTTEKATKMVTINSTDHSVGISRVTGVSFNYDKLDYTETRTTYIAENIPALKGESYVNNILNYTSCISHDLATIQFPNSKLETFSTDWESVTKRIYKYDDFGGELDKTGYFENDISSVLVGKTTSEEKIAAIFTFVKSKVNWNEIYDYSCNEGVRQAYKNNTGNVAEINLMLTAMLRYAGLNANPVLISTRENGIAYFPSISAFDYVISGVELENGLVLLDATDKYSIPNVLPERDLNWFGRLIRNDGTSQQINLMPKTVSKAVFNVSGQLKSDGVIDGKIRKQYSDQFALKFRSDYGSQKKEDYIEALEDEFKIETGEYSRENENDLGKAIVEIYNFTDADEVETIGEKLYLSPFLFLATKENPFKQETREYPIDFSFPRNIKYNIILEIPAEYVLETLPGNMNIAIPDSLGSFKSIIAQSGNKIQVSATLDINQAIIGSEYYEALKAFYKELVNKQTEKIVLKKV